MGLYEVPLSMSLLGFEMETVIANSHMCGIMLLLRDILNMLVRNARSRGPMCFRCLIFSLSGPCELVFWLCFLASWALIVMNVMLYLCMCFSVNGSVCFVCCVPDSVCDLFGEFAICLSVVVILLLKVMLYGLPKSVSMCVVPVIPLYV